MRAKLVMATCYIIQHLLTTSSFAAMKPLSWVDNNGVIECAVRFTHATLAFLFHG